MEQKSRILGDDEDQRKKKHLVREEDRKVRIVEEGK